MTGRSGRPSAPRRAARLPRRGAVRGAGEPRLRGRGRGRAPGSARHIARSRAGSPRRGDRPGVGRAGGSRGRCTRPSARSRSSSSRSSRRGRGRRRPDHGRARRTGRASRSRSPCSSRRLAWPGSWCRATLSTSRASPERSRPTRRARAGSPPAREAGPLRLELVPRTVLLRNPAFAWVRGVPLPAERRVPLWWPPGWRRSRSCWYADRDRPAPGSVRGDRPDANRGDGGRGDDGGPGPRARRWRRRWRSSRSSGAAR